MKAERGFRRQQSMQLAFPGRDHIGPTHIGVGTGRCLQLLLQTLERSLIRQSVTQNVRPEAGDQLADHRRAVPGRQHDTGHWQPSGVPTPASTKRLGMRVPISISRPHRLKVSLHNLNARSTAGICVALRSRCRVVVHDQQRAAGAHPLARDVAAPSTGSFRWNNNSRANTRSNGSRIDMRHFRDVAFDEAVHIRARYD